MFAANPHYFPLAPLFLLILFIGLVILIAVVELGILRYAYEKLGVSPRYVYLLLFLSLFGSYVNIPVYRLAPEKMEKDQIVWYYGTPYVVPHIEESPGTIVAINVGGALIPALLSFYLLFRNRLWVPGVIGVAVVTIVVHLLAKPVRGVGITVPTFVPPLVAVGVALVLSREYAPPLAYISGSLGTLLGADILNLGRIGGLGAPVASIGGAGTFDGVFLTGIIAVLLAPVGQPRRQPPPAFVNEPPAERW